MMLAQRLQQYLSRLSPPTRVNLLTELERLEKCDDEMPGRSELVATLRADLGIDPSVQTRVSPPFRYFFAPLEPLLVDGAPQHENFGRILRGSLPPIWEWIGRDLLPTMARDYIKNLDQLVNVDNKRKARQVAAAFQTKVLKSLEGTLNSAAGVNQTRAKLGAYTASHAAFTDLNKMVCVLRARDALAKFNDALPSKIINQLDDGRVAKLTAVLDPLRKSHADAVPYGITMIASRLRTPWHMIRLATKGAPSKNAADVAAMPYAIAVSMVLDRLEDQRFALRIALKNNRVLVAKQLLTEIYDLEYALQVRIDGFNQSDWGKRLAHLMNTIAELVQQEVSRFPDNIGHILGSRSLRSHQSLSGRLTYLAWKGRDAVSDGAAFCKRLVGQG